MIKEDFLHYVWKLKKFNHSELSCTIGKNISIVDYGSHNHDSGPDFFNARITIDSVTWVGNVEMHILSSDWTKHGHSSDTAYENVILHVVFEEDVPILDENGNKISCLELKNKLYSSDLKKYRLLQLNKNWVPCSPHLNSISRISKINAIENAALSRLSYKAQYIKNVLDATNTNWERSFIIILFRYFGANINGDAFEMLAKSIDPHVLEKEKNEEINLEALLFGQAGLLQENQADEYPNRLYFIYQYQKRKYGLRSIPPSTWKFLRMRPVSFPTIRISQLASLLFKNRTLFDKVRDAASVKQLHEFFSCSSSRYWNDHYLFDKKSKTIKKTLSSAFRDKILINVVAPFYFIYAFYKNDDFFKTKAVSLWEDIKFEKNRIIDKWGENGIKAMSALDSQGLIELKKGFCDKKQCLRCPIGYEIMNSNKN